MKSIFLLGREFIHLFGNLFPKTENWLAEWKHFWHILKTIFGKHLKGISETWSQEQILSTLVNNSLECTVKVDSLDGSNQPINRKRPIMWGDLKKIKSRERNYCKHLNFILYYGYPCVLVFLKQTKESI